MKRTARRKRHRINAYFPVVNRPRRKRYSMNHKRRHHRRNPSKISLVSNRRHRHRRNPPDILGFDIKDVAMAGAAVIIAPWIEKQIMTYLPTSMAGTTQGRWIVKIGATVGIGYAAKRFLGPKAANLAVIALGANLVADAVAEFMPTLTTSLSYYTPVGMGGGPYIRPGQLGAGMPYTGIPSKALPAQSWGGDVVMNQFRDPLTPPW